MMKIAIGADERLPIVETILDFVTQKGYTPEWFGPQKGETASWSKVALQVSQAIVEQRVAEGILLCWTGTGVCMAANKVRGIRAALCIDAETARGARLWNNANVLCLSMRLTSEPVAREILTAWFHTTYQPNPTDDACLAVITALDDQRKESSFISGISSHHTS